MKNNLDYLKMIIKLRVKMDISQEELAKELILMFKEEEYE